MKSATWRRLSRTYMVPHLPPVRLVRNLTIFPPTEHLLRALSTDSSGFSGVRFVVEAFVMPLYVPSDHIYYTFGGRLGALSGHQERWWTISDENESEVMREVLDLIRKEALPFLNRLSNPRELAEHIHRDVHPDNRRTDPHLAESEAYSWIVAGEPGQARAAFDRLARIGRASRATTKVRLLGCKKLPNEAKA